MTICRAIWTSALASAAVVLGIGCSDDVTNSQSDVDAIASDGGNTDVETADAGADTSATDAGTGTGSTQPWWTCPTDAATAPQRTAGCETPDDGSYGCKRAWGGLTAAGKTFTCNRCLGGDPNAQGAWRAVDFATEDPTVALPGDRAELLIIDGNTWHLRARGKDQGASVEVHVDGWYACTDGAELTSQHRHIFSKDGHATREITGDDVARSEVQKFRQSDL